MGIKVPTDNLLIENAKIDYRNFAGAPTPFNAKGGDRAFSVVLDTIEQAQALEDMGWKVKYSKPREDGSDPRFPAHMPVSIKYHPRLRPPIVKMITSRGITTLDEEAIDVIDFMSIKKVDLSLRPRLWEFNGREGVKNMLASIYVTVLEDELEQRYAHLPEVGPGTVNQRAIESSDAWGTGLEDLGEVAENQYALEQGRGF